jgi:4-hydroxy-tetrahydrodipicolinate synthase
MLLDSPQAQRVEKLTTISGICPAVFTLYTDATCRTIDYAAQRAHYRKLLQHEISALVIGCHAGEISALTPEERAELIAIAKDEAKGRVPVIDGIVADSTSEAIRRGKEAVAAGADAVLFTSPAIPGWRDEINVLLQHYGAFEDAVGIPIVLFGSPSDRYGQQFALTPVAARALVKSLQSVIGMKITAQWDIGGFLRIANAMREVRNVGCLKAGGQAQFAHYVYGCDGSLSGGSNFSTADDIAVRALCLEGKLAEAKAVSDSWMPVYDAIYGTQVGLPVVYFHYRYKLAAWLTGAIEAPWMRRPQLAPPLEDILVLRDALLRAGKPVVRDVQQGLPVAAV